MSIDPTQPNKLLAMLNEVRFTQQQALDAQANAISQTDQIIQLVSGGDISIMPGGVEADLKRLQSELNSVLGRLTATDTAAALPVTPADGVLSHAQPAQASPAQPTAVSPADNPLAEMGTASRADATPNVPEEDAQPVKQDDPANDEHEALAILAGKQLDQGGASKLEEAGKSEQAGQAIAEPTVAGQQFNEEEAINALRGGEATNPDDALGSLRSIFNAKADVEAADDLEDLRQETTPTVTEGNTEKKGFGQFFGRS